VLDRIYNIEKDKVGVVAYELLKVKLIIKKHLWQTKKK